MDHEVTAAIAAYDARARRTSGTVSRDPVARAEIGRAARRRLPRSQVGQYVAAVDRADPIDLLLGQERSRLEGLLPLRHERMGASAFAFYRGSAVIMTADLAHEQNSGLAVELCGDAHLSNFGLFAAPDRVPVFDINDFDETHVGPFEWDVKRLATSFVLAARDRGWAESIGRTAARAAAAQYRASIRRYSLMGELDIWYDRVDASHLEEWSRSVDAKMAPKRLDRAMRKAQARNAWSAVEKLTSVVDGQRRFLDQPPVLVRVPEGTRMRRSLADFGERYLETLQPDRARLITRYRMVDFGHKVVGVGSVGLLAWVVLLQGRDDTDVLVLQLKQAQASVLEPYTGPSAFGHHGQRVVEGQRLIQAAPDSFLGWSTGELGRQYYVRQLRDMKWSPDPARMPQEALTPYALLCGHALARAHARSGDSIAIAAYAGTSETFDRAIEEFSVEYALQAERDYAAFQDAVASGRLAGGESPSDLSYWHDLMLNPPTPVDG